MAAGVASGVVSSVPVGTGVGLRPALEAGASGELGAPVFWLDGICAATKLVTVGWLPSGLWASGAGALESAGVTVCAAGVPGGWVASVAGDGVAKDVGDEPAGAAGEADWARAGIGFELDAGAAANFDATAGRAETSEGACGIGGWLAVVAAAGIASPPSGFWPAGTGAPGFVGVAGSLAG